MKNKRNPIAKQLRTSTFRKRVVAMKKKNIPRTSKYKDDWKDEIKYDHIYQERNTY